MSEAIEITGLLKSFGGTRGTVPAVDHVTMTVPAGEICVLLGPSGCGKTTLMRMVNRLIRPTSGMIKIGGRDTSSIPNADLRRGIGYVIQQIGLFPNMTVEANICTVPDLLGWDRVKSRRRAAELLEMVALDPAVFLQRYPHELSGGQQQRVGVARALAADPPVMLMDEPFGAIDPINREVIQNEFLRMQERLSKTIIFVSHDLDEAVKMGDRIAILRAGKLEQYATPDEILANPCNDFVADFVGRDRNLKRLRLVTAGQLARDDLPTAQPEMALADLRKSPGVSGCSVLPVVDEDGRFLGRIDLVATAALAGTTRAHMTCDCATVGAEESLRDAVSELYAGGGDWVAVCDTDGMYRGAITHEDVRVFLAAPPAPRSDRSAA